MFIKKVFIEEIQEINKNLWIIATILQNVPLTANVTKVWKVETTEFISWHVEPVLISEAAIRLTHGDMLIGYSHAVIEAAPDTK